MIIGNGIANVGYVIIEMKQSHNEQMQKTGTYMLSRKGDPLGIMEVIKIRPC